MLEKESEFVVWLLDTRTRNVNKTLSAPSAITLAYLQFVTDSVW